MAGHLSYAKLGYRTLRILVTALTTDDEICLADFKRNILSGYIGSTYTTFNGLIRDGWLTDRREESNPTPRRLFRLTKEGKEKLSEMMIDLVGQEAFDVMMGKP